MPITLTTFQAGDRVVDLQSGRTGTVAGGPSRNGEALAFYWIDIGSGPPIRRESREIEHIQVVAANRNEIGHAPAATRCSGSNRSLRFVREPAVRRARLWGLAILSLTAIAVLGAAVVLATTFLPGAERL